MAAQSDTGNLTYYINGEPINGIYRVGTSSITYYINGGPMLTIFPIEVKSFGQFFLMF